MVIYEGVYRTEKGVTKRPVEKLAITAWSLSLRNDLPVGAILRRLDNGLIYRRTDDGWKEIQ